VSHGEKGFVWSINFEVYSVHRGSFCPDKESDEWKGAQIVLDSERHGKKWFRALQ